MFQTKAQAFYSRRTHVNIYVKPHPYFWVLVYLYLYADDSVIHGPIYSHGAQILYMNEEG